MRLLDIATKTYPEDPVRFFHFEKYFDNKNDFFFIAGIFEFAELLKHKDKKIVYLEVEDPNRFFTNNEQDKFEKYFHKIFTICPYTAGWLNKKYGNNKRTSVFLPFNEEYIPQNKEKKYDVIYVGHIVSDKILKLISDISKFNYKFVSQSEHPLVTDKDVSYIEKLNLISQSRITVVQNLLYLKDSHRRKLNDVHRFKKNGAFKLIPSFYNPLEWFCSRHTPLIAPQIKTRMFEAAFSKSLILCRKDPWNVIEEFFIPDVEFIYYNEGELVNKIQEILSNFERYLPIIDNAFARAIREYTTKRFMEKYLSNIT